SRGKNAKAGVSQTGAQLDEEITVVLGKENGVVLRSRQSPGSRIRHSAAGTIVRACSLRTNGSRCQSHPGQTTITWCRVGSRPRLERSHAYHPVANYSPDR